MAKSNLCGDDQMKCSNDECRYEHIPEIDFKWLTKETINGKICVVKKRKLVANSIKEKFFNLPCTPSNVSCKLENSIVIWSEDLLKQCPLAYVTTLKNLTVIDNVIVNSKNGILFQSVIKKRKCNLDYIETTEGLFLSTDNSSLKLLKSYDDNLNNRFKLM